MSFSVTGSTQLMGSVVGTNCATDWIQIPCATNTMDVMLQTGTPCMTDIVKPTYLHTYLPTNLPTYPPTYLPTDLTTYITKHSYEGQPFKVTKCHITIIYFTSHSRLCNNHFSRLRGSALRHGLQLGHHTVRFSSRPCQ